MEPSGEHPPLPPSRSTPPQSPPQVTLPTGSDQPEHIRPTPEFEPRTKRSTEGSTEETAHKSRRRRRSSSRRPSNEDFNQKSRPVKMSSSLINQVAILLFSILIAAVLIVAAYFYGKKEGAAPPQRTDAPRTSTAPAATGVPAGAASRPSDIAGSLPATTNGPEGDVERALQLVDEFFEAFFERDPDKAFAKLEEAREAAPGFPGLDYHMAKIRHRQGKLMEATQHIQQALIRGEDISEANILKGQILASQNQHGAAYLAFAEAVAADPYRPYAFFYWGETLREEGKPREAVTRLKQAHTRAFEQPDAFVIHMKFLIARVEADDHSFFEAELQPQLLSPDAGGEWFIAAAALALRDNQISEAAKHLKEAQSRLQTKFYRYVIQDKYFDLYRTNSELDALLKTR